jgi:predicted AAA+ superfamily ATPase
MLVLRKRFIDEIDRGFKTCPIVALLGPRQCGKTTLAKEYFKATHSKTCRFFDAEDPEQRMLLIQNPKTLELVTEDYIVIDEVQLLRDIFPYLRVLVDKSNKKLLLLGSASRDLITHSSETLAGRIDYVRVSPFNITEVSDINTLWMRGGFPKSFLAGDDDTSFRWRNNYIMTYLERDVLQLFHGVNSDLMRQIWMMVAHYHGNIVNYSEVSRSLGVADMTIRRYMEILNGTFMVRKLQPWFENISKRQVKSPKIYIRDSGILHNLLGVSENSYKLNPKVGASWEGFAMEQIIAQYALRDEECYFWNAQSVCEVDLLVIKGVRKIAFEFKYATAPIVTKQMQDLFPLLRPDKFIIITPGAGYYQIDDMVSVCGLGSKEFTNLF